LKVNGNTRSLQSGFQLSNQENSCEINFIGISFKDEGAIRYRYRLTGTETEWQGPTLNNSITYGHLDPGSYRFEVNAINIDGVESGKPASIAIMIHPPYWQTWWFRSAVVMLFLAVGPSIYYVRVSKMKKAQLVQQAFSRQLMESQEAERRRVARELHDDIGQELTVISARARRGVKIATEDKARGQFVLIIDSAGRALESIREIASNLSPYHLEQVGLSGSIRGMVTKIASLTDIRFTLGIDLLDSKLAKESEIHLYRIVQECVSNIVKHSEASEARISMKLHDHALEITIADNGKGFDPAARAVSTDQRRRGFGLSGVTERVTLLKGTVSFESAIGSGTTNRITVPLENK